MKPSDDILGGLCITMPCFNEAEGLEGFIEELFSELDIYLVKIIIINDNSTDDTLFVINKLLSRFPKVICHTNKVNLGHGPSSVIGMRLALETQSEYILTIDGDGQFLPLEIKEFLQNESLSDFEVLEGVRKKRKDPYFRKIVTFLLRVMVYFSTKKFPSDANTPLRLYHRSTLEKLVTSIDPSSPTPNLRISILSRKLNLKIQQREFTSIVRRGHSQTGTTWKSKRDYLPSKRFLSFCFRAALKLLRN
jgi:glycosyltransferase involved in cell wall biosynthesis